MLQPKAAATIHRARALRLRARGLRFMAGQHREKIHTLRERIWAGTELARFERAGYLEEIALLHHMVHRLRKTVGS